MTPDDLRLLIAELLEDELGLDVRVQGKRLVVEGQGLTAIILVSAPRPEAEKISL